MKLYATIQSERATKGQGGNKWLRIAITDEQMRLLYNLRFDVRDNGIIQLHERNENGEIRENTIYRELTKGKQQIDKFECFHPEPCLNCPPKGKQQKGEIHSHDWNYLSENVRECKECGELDHY